MRDPLLGQIVRAYDDPVVRAYCWGRFGILRQRFLVEIGQYLPPEGLVLDIGCGFGLFSLYYASVQPGRRVHGIDVDRRRIGIARRAAARLGRENVAYEEGDARQVSLDGRRFAAAYMLDIVHHLPEADVPPLIAALARALPAGARLLVKDVDSTPAYKRWFTWALDRIMSPRSPVSYWPAQRLQDLLTREGFTVYRHSMVDILPYPHVLYICERRP
jgi:2-polyprenyl-3-methyl-5-hydroxy-6-metoxy-1,4-benzoquinol methylase